VFEPKITNIVQTLIQFIMGRKEFYERLEELNRIRMNIMSGIQRNIQAEHSKLLNEVDHEITHLKLLQESK
jgi:hypothetical protein